MILPPSEWYSQQDLSRHFMRRTDGPFEDGVSRGQLRAIKECEKYGYFVTQRHVTCAYHIIEENRSRKGRKYGMSLDDWLQIEAEGLSAAFLISPGPIAAALCVRVSPTTLYVSGWGDIAGKGGLSPVTFVCRGIYQWCRENGITTMDIGIADERGLVDFKLRLGFTRSCDAK